MPNFRFKQVDVFTVEPFQGNPVAVVIGAEGLASEEMQRIAGWTNLSETTFVLAPSSVNADYRLRIFSPKQELPFAGHPVVGSAHAVLESGYAAPRDGVLRQECSAGIFHLSIEETREGKQIFVRVPQPKIAALGEDAKDALSAALGRPPVPTLEALRIEVGLAWIVADLGDAGTVARLKPSLEAVAKLSEASAATGVTVFGRANDGISALHTRSFAPAQGIPEDPVCGSGNASVAAYLIHTRKLDGYGAKYIARQGMQVGRDGHVAVRVSGASIEIGGHAVTCVDGQLCI